MVIDIEKHIVIGLNDEESRLFSVMLKLAMKGYDKIKETSNNPQFVLVGEKATSYDEMKAFIEDLMRGIK